MLRSQWHRNAIKEMKIPAETTRFDGEMKLQTTYMYYDGPLIFTFIDNSGELMLAYIIEDDREIGVSKYAMAPITEQQAKWLDDDTITCIDVFKDNECWIMVDHWKKKGVVCYEIEFDELSDVIKEGMALPWHT